MQLTQFVKEPGTIVKNYHDCPQPIMQHGGNLVLVMEFGRVWCLTCRKTLRVLVPACVGGWLPLTPEEWT